MAENIDQIFLTFRNNKEAFDELKFMVADLKQEKPFGPNILRSLKILSADATYGSSFSTVRLAAEHQFKHGYGVSSVNLFGMRVLEDYLNENPVIPKDANERKALQHLLEFLSSSQSGLTAPKAGKGEWAVQLAEHLLSKLTVEGSYIIDNHYQKHQFDFTDEEQEKIKLRLGDTSFGLADGWHGSSDILMNSIPVNLAGDDDDDDGSSSVTSESPVEMKANNFQMRDVKQMIAQTIVFSFLQLGNGKLRHSLVPTIGISKDTVLILFYDSKHDVLLLSCNLPLFFADRKHSQVFKPTIVFLWLTLNYKYFCSGVVPEMKDEKSGLFEILGKQSKHLEKYQQETKMPCKPVAKDEENLLRTLGVYIIATTPEVDPEEIQFCALELPIESLKL